MLDLLKTSKEFMSKHVCSLTTCKTVTVTVLKTLTVLSQLIILIIFNFY